MTPPKFEPEYGTMKQSGVGQYVKLSDYRDLESKLNNIMLLVRDMNQTSKGYAKSGMDMFSGTLMRQGMDLVEYELKNKGL